MESITKYIIQNKYKRAFREKSFIRAYYRIEKRYIEGLNSRQVLLLAAIEIMKDNIPNSAFEDVLTFIDKNDQILPKEVAELRIIRSKSLQCNLTRLIKKLETKAGDQ